MRPTANNSSSTTLVDHLDPVDIGRVFFWSYLLPAAQPAMRFNVVIWAGWLAGDVKQTAKRAGEDEALALGRGFLFWGARHETQNRNGSVDHTDVAASNASDPRRHAALGPG
jgi:hypothetical protein